jgi:uncharacterized protein
MVMRKRIFYIIFESASPSVRLGPIILVFPQFVRRASARSHSMDHAAARAYILDRLSAELPATLFYHAYRHTIDVMKAGERLARAEGVIETDVQLVITAGAFHDSGFIEKYEHNEAIGADMAAEALPAFGFDTASIAGIREMILATCLPQCPANHLAQILCDADLDYLGRDDFFTVGHLLFRELAAHGNVLRLLEWYQLEEQFLASHTYFTAAAREERGVKKQSHLEQIRELLGARG